MKRLIKSKLNKFAEFSLGYKTEIKDVEDIYKEDLKKCKIIKNELGD